MLDGSHQMLDVEEKRREGNMGSRRGILERPVPWLMGRRGARW